MVVWLNLRKFPSIDTYSKYYIHHYHHCGWWYPVVLRQWRLPYLFLPPPEQFRCVSRQLLNTFYGIHDDQPDRETVLILGPVIRCHIWEPLDVFRTLQSIWYKVFGPRRFRTFDVCFYLRLSNSDVVVVVVIVVVVIAVLLMDLK